MNINESTFVNRTTFSEKTNRYLDNFKKKYRSQNIISILQSLKKIKVLVVGDCILDEYAFCDTMERAKKEPILVFKHIETELYAGGSLAIANHVSNFVGKVGLITLISSEEKLNDFVNNKLNNNIQRYFFQDKNNMTLIKRRYIERYRNRKLFEVYNYSGYDIETDTEKKVIETLKEQINEHDLIIIADFGHGFITNSIKNALLETKKFLAINSQTNSGNLGYNYITKYKNFHFASLTEEELRLPLQNAKSECSDLIKQLSELVHCKKVCITRGRQGILYYDNGIYEAPVFSNKVVDTVGAGDAILSLISLLAFKEVTPELIPFIGNCVGALAVRIMGNRDSLDPISLNRFIIDLLN